MQSPSPALTPAAPETRAPIALAPSAPAAVPAAPAAPQADEKAEKKPEEAEKKAESKPAEVVPQAVTKSLPVNYEAQVTGYWCGPAATRIAMSSKTGELPSQTELAGLLGTTENGTDHVGQVADGLNKLLGPTGTQYVAKDLSSRQVSPEMKKELWDDTVRNIDGGKAMVANIVAPPGNQPPGYPSSQTIYHYVSIVGYDAEKNNVQIADPANFGGNKEYWLSLDQLTSLVQPRGYVA
ncbi:C39 family peptidase [Saccharopolyspora sp. TS4A08]|uniref:C39 family peptidase n=1 Tax=Saccharopolyspora ipomoeae TaxID=3042027 RepID=A0ABT6PVJ5_9PSEU|nr:C39 family peptidase [Saccharopolyspora sp. TS4A08]MDI2031436.1 C39 family peptidase [Saccharopolyspora sp. TS4A08]